MSLIEDAKEEGCTDEDVENAVVYVRAWIRLKDYEKWEAETDANDAVVQLDFEEIQW